MDAHEPTTPVGSVQGEDVIYEDDHDHDRGLAHAELATVYVLYKTFTGKHHVCSMRIDEDEVAFIPGDVDLRTLRLHTVPSLVDPSNAHVEISTIERAEGTITTTLVQRDVAAFDDFVGTAILGVVHKHSPPKHFHASVVLRTEGGERSVLFAMSSDPQTLLLSMATTIGDTGLFQSIRTFVASLSGVSIVKGSTCVRATPMPPIRHGRELSTETHSAWLETFLTTPDSGTVGSQVPFDAAVIALSHLHDHERPDSLLDFELELSFKTTNSETESSEGQQYAFKAPIHVKEKLNRNPKLPHQMSWLHLSCNPTSLSEMWSLFP